MSRKKIGLVLGSGSARGFAHIGVLSVLEKHGIRPDYIAGTSIGAAVGALYATGMSAEYMKRLTISTEWQDLLDFTIPKTGVIAGNNIEEYLQDLTNNCKFKDLVIPLAVVATDIKNAHKVVFAEGNVAKAVRASISVPGVFSPVEIDSHELVDGGLVDPIPIDVAKNMGADIIIAVDLSISMDEIYIHGSRVKERSTFGEYVKDRFLKTEMGFVKEFIWETKKFRLPHFVKKYLIKFIDRLFNPKRVYNFMTKRRIPHILEVTMHSMQIMSSQIYKQKLIAQKVDVIIRPELSHHVSSSFDHAPQIIEAGEKATEAQIENILKLVGKDIC